MRILASLIRNHQLEVALPVTKIELNDRGGQRTWSRQHGKIGPRLPSEPAPRQNTVASMLLEDCPEEKNKVVRGREWQNRTAMPPDVGLKALSVDSTRLNPAFHLMMACQ